MRPIQTAVQLFGSPTLMASALEVKPPTVMQWLLEDDDPNYRPVPLPRAMQIERLLAGKITREALRPDVDWRRWSELSPEEQKAAA